MCMFSYVLTASFSMCFSHTYTYSLSVKTKTFSGNTHVWAVPL